MRPGFPPRRAKHGVCRRTRNGFSQPGRISMTTLYRCRLARSLRAVARPLRKGIGTRCIGSAASPHRAFGANEYGLLDLSGNVWEWTNTCFMRQSLDAKGKPAGASTANCGVRVVEGEHRTYVTDFVRDARGGGCAVGKPPSNLGFRLVREDNGVATIASVLRGLAPNH